MKSSAIILWALLTSVLLPVSVLGAKLGDTVRGNFGNYTDLSPLRTGVLQEDAALAKAAYNDGTIPPGYRAATRAEYNRYIGLTSQKNIQYDPNTGYFQTIGLPDGSFWDSIMDTVTGSGNSNNGLAGRILVNEKDGSFVLAFRGTEGSLEDVSADVFQALGGVPGQYKEAAEMLENLVSKTEAEQIPIKVVGHSLGGALAAYSTLECNDITRVTTTTFNTAGLYPSNINQAHLSVAALKITNIRVDEDPISNSTGLLVGDVYDLDSENMMNDAISDGIRKGASVGGLIGSAGGGIGGTVAGKVMAHSMDTVIELMNRDSSPSQTGISDDTAGIVNESRVPDENNPANGDLISSSGSSNDDGGMCRVPDDKTPANGDLTSSSGSSNDDGGMCYAPQDGSAAETDATQYPGDSQVSWKSNPGSGSLPTFGDVMNEFADQAALVGPNLPYRRILWLFSGESPWDSFKTSFSSLLSGASDDDKKYFSEMRDALQTITGIGN